MFYGKLTIANDRLSCYLMQKHLVIDFESFVAKFDINTSLPKSIVRSFSERKKHLTINMLFLYSTFKDLSGKLMITSLFLEDKILTTLSISQSFHRLLILLEKWKRNSF